MGTAPITCLVTVANKWLIYTVDERVHEQMEGFFFRFSVKKNN